MKRSPFLFLLTFCVIAYSLTSCDSGDTKTAAGFPYIVYTNPSNNDTDVSPVTGIQIVFNNEMDETTVDATSVTITDLYGIDVPISTNCTGRTVTVTPSSTLDENMKYTVTVASTLKDINGTTMGYTHKTEFYTLLSWGTPELLESWDGDALNPKIAIDKSGNAIVVWNQSSNLFANLYNSETGWTGPDNLESHAGSANSQQIAFDESGNAIVIWVQTDGTYNSLYANWYRPESGWAGRELIETNEGHSANPQIAFFRTGNAIVVWEHYSGSRSDIRARRYNTESGWADSVLIETDNDGSAKSPKIAVDASNNAIVVWSQNDGTRENAWANRYTPESGWTGPVLIENDNTGYVLTPQIGCDNSGNAIAVWHQHFSTEFYVYANRFTPSSGWTGPVRIQPESTYSGYDPRIAFDTSGNAIVVWYQYSMDYTITNIWAKQYTPASGWADAELIEKNIETASSPQIAFDASGNAISVWRQNDGMRFNLWASRYTPESGWDTAMLIETDDADSSSVPQIAFDESGNAIVVWSQGDGTRYNLWTNRYTYSY